MIDESAYLLCGASWLLLVNLQGPWHPPESPELLSRCVSLEHCAQGVDKTPAPPPQATNKTSLGVGKQPAANLMEFRVKVQSPSPPGRAGKAQELQQTFSGHLQPPAWVSCSGAPAPTPALRQLLCSKQREGGALLPPGSWKAFRQVKDELRGRENY